jgi:transposase InsO family protein
MGIRDKPIAAGSPWQNSIAERLIGTIRRECVDHIVVLGETHLRRILRKYARYYNTARTHRSLAAGLSPDSADRTHRVARSGWRAASPIRPDLGFRHAHVGRLSKNL